MYLNRFKTNNEVTLSSPWVIYYRKLRALFDYDPDVVFNFIDDSDEPEIKMLVSTIDKADALGRLLPEEMAFGNVTLKITIIPPNPSTMEKEELIERAFRDNPALVSMKTIEMFGGEEHYAMFAKEVVQYPSDDISEYGGVTSTLYQDLAKELFGEEMNLHYCTSRMCGEHPTF